MTSHALLFPGQGAQFVGMTADLCAASPEAARVMQQANDLLGFDLRKICYEGPAEELSRTDISQPAILAHSWAVYEALKAHSKGREIVTTASYMAGLSLGEYSALAAAGAMAWADALKLVRKRGQFMQEACDATPSTMASVLGLDEGPLGEACKQASELGVCVMANFNSPGQIVIAGTQEAVARASELAKAAGAKRCIPLDVAGAFHSPLMEPARERLAREIESTDFADPMIPVVANVTAKPITTAAEAKQLLIDQLTSPVRWADSMAWLVAQATGAYYELGPGNVLSGLLRKVAANETPKTSIGTAEQLAQLG